MKTLRDNHSDHSSATITSENNKSTDELTDRELSSRLKRLLPDAPPQPMFTRMVMNRLTRRSARIASIIEYTLYIIGIATTGVIATKLAIQMSSGASVGENQTLTLMALIVVFFSLIYALFSPFVGEREE